MAAAVVHLSVHGRLRRAPEIVSQTCYRPSLLRCRAFKQETGGDDEKPSSPPPKRRKGPLYKLKAALQGLAGSRSAAAEVYGGQYERAVEKAEEIFFSLVSLISMEKAIWDAHYVRFFCDICMEEVNANNRDGGCLSRKGYKNLEDKFAEKTGKRLTKKQFKNKWDSLKKEYTGWMELLNATGLGWDSETKTMDADNDWWQTHLQYRPEHVKFRFVGTYYLVDSGYPNRKGFLAPYKNNTYHIPDFRREGPPTKKEEIFNHAHSSLRNCIERIFGILKNKWRILKGIPHFDLVTQKKIIIACCVLHNFIRDSNLRDKQFDRCDADEDYMPKVQRQTITLPSDHVSAELHTRGMNGTRDDIANTLFISRQRRN